MPVWYNAAGYRYAGAVIFFIILQWLAAIGRVIVRVFYVKKFGWDDVALIVTLIISTAYDAILLAICKISNGGVRADHIPPGGLVPSINLTLASFCTYIAGTTALKIACALLLLRVLVRKWQVWTIYVCITISTVYGIVFFFASLFQCGNPNEFHIKMLFGGRCFSKATINGTNYTHSILLALIDLIFAALPIALIWNTNMPRRAKLSVAGILGLGSVAVIATFARFAYIADLTKPSLDFLNETQPLALLAVLEMSIGVTCISICTYKPFFQRFYRSGEYESFVSAEGKHPQSSWPSNSSKFDRGGRRAPENTEVSTSTWRTKEVDIESDITSVGSPVKTPQLFANALHSHPSQSRPSHLHPSTMRNNRNTI